MDKISFKANVKSHGNSLGFNIPKSIIEAHSIDVDDTVSVVIFHTKKNFYRCGVCSYDYSSNDEFDSSCPACGEIKHIYKLEDYHSNGQSKDEEAVNGD